jgi:hypothetical protein
MQEPVEGVVVMAAGGRRVFITLRGVDVVVAVVEERAGQVTALPLLQVEQAVVFMVVAVVLLVILL